MKKTVIKIVGIFVVAALFSGAALVLKPRKLGAAVEITEFVIEKGQSLGSIARALAERDLIISRYLFVGYAIFSGNEENFKAGRYLIPPQASTKNLVDVFSQGLAESEDIEVTIPEGTNIADIDKIFSKTGLIKAGDISGYNLKHGGVLVQEGFLFPDTYRFRHPEADRPLSMEEIIQKMKDNFNIKTRDLFASRFTGEGGADRGYQVIIVASILEKEVRTEEDMSLVAGIIQKRLDSGMPLEIDATVAYGVCYPQFSAGKYCDVTQADVVDNIPIDSAYNTYRRKGLPLGPISNPGLTAIRAALNSQPSDYLFYLSAKDGTTVFSRTAAEHLKAKRKYLSR